MSTRIKVRIEALIEKIEQARDRAVAEYEVELAKVEGKVEKANALVDSAIRQIGAGQVPFTTDDIWQDYKGGKYVWVVEVKLPRKFEVSDIPGEPNVTSYNKDIALLKMADQDTILVSTEDRYGKYL